jgi:hypothetical protein
VGIKANPAAATLAAAGTDRTLRALLLELLEASFDLAVTGGDLLLIELDQFDGLLKPLNLPCLRDFHQGINSLLWATPLAAIFNANVRSLPSGETYFCV